MGHYLTWTDGIGEVFGGFLTSVFGVFLLPAVEVFNKLSLSSLRGGVCRYKVIRVHGITIHERASNSKNHVLKCKSSEQGYYRKRYLCLLPANARSL